MTLLWSNAQLKMILQSRLFTLGLLSNACGRNEAAGVCRSPFLVTVCFGFLAVAKVLQEASAPFFIYFFTFGRMAQNLPHKTKAAKVIFFNESIIM